MTVFRSFTALVLSTALGTTAMAANPMVGGAAMFEEKNIVENAVNSADHPTLVAGDGLHPSGVQYGQWIEEILPELLYY